MDADSSGESLGVARLNELNGLVNTIKKYHPGVAETTQVSPSPQDGLAIPGGRLPERCKSDQGIRDAKSAIRHCRRTTQR